MVRPRRLPLPTDAELRRLPEMLDTLEDWFGPYPFHSFRAVVVDDPLEIPMEAQDMAVFGTNHLVPGWDNERLVVHELSHQWFGNAVTAGRMRDIWLHEGFACYAEWLWSEKRGLATADERAAPAPHVAGRPGTAGAAVGSRRGHHVRRLGLQAWGADAARPAPGHR